MIATYRDPRYAASVRIAQLQERMPWTTDEVPQELRLVHARRAGRTWAGKIAIGGFVTMAIAAAVRFAITSSLPWPRPSWSGYLDLLSPTLLLVASVLASLAAYGVARSRAWSRFPSIVRASLAGGDDALTQLARLESQSAREAAERLAARGEKESLSMPLAGAGLLAPLTIHLVVWSLFKGFAPDFDWWIAASLVLVGVAHVVLAVMGFRFAAKAASMSTQDLSRKMPISGWAVWGWTIFGSIFPGVIALAIPVVLVAVTGVVFIPAMYSAMYRAALDERRALGIE
jgi:hypothetical protein